MLLIRRRGPHGEGMWSTPGGFLEPGEEPSAAALRELSEETGLEGAGARFLGVTNDVFEEEGRHSVTLWFETEAGAGAPRPSPEVSEIGWFSEDDLPEPLFLSFRNLIAGRFVE